MTPRSILIWIAATIGACSAIVTAWIQIGGPVPASQLYVTQSGDAIKKEMTRGFKKVESAGRHQTEESAKLGKEIYTQKVRGYLVIPPPQDPVQRQYWKEQINDAQRQQKYYEDLEIQLKKK